MTRRPLVLLLCLASVGASALADEPPSLPTSAIGNPTFETTWGTTVRRSGDVLAVARAGFPSGSVSVFREVAGVWTQQQQLEAPGAGDEDGFARALDVAGDVLVVGAPFADVAATDAGAAYVYRYDGAAWSLEAALFPNDIPAPDSSTSFGRDVATDGDVVLVSSTGEDDVWEFTWDGAAWQQIERFEPSLPPFAFFGDTLALDASRALVADTSDDVVYVWRRDPGGWVEEDALTPSGSEVLFGNDADLSGGTAVVASTSAASVYERSGSTWSFVQELDVPPRLAVDGTLVAAVDGLELVVGAPWGDGATNGSGVAFLYRRVAGTWTLDATLTQGTGLVGDRFGTAVDVADGEAFTSATSAGLVFTGPGTVYVHDVAPAGAWCDLGGGLAGQLGFPTLTGTGTLEPLTPVTLTLSDAAAPNPAVLVVGFSELGALFKGGLLVPAPDVVADGLTAPLVIVSTWPAGCRRASRRCSRSGSSTPWARPGSPPATACNE